MFLEVRMEKSYKYELHLHTSEGSRCSHMTAKEAVDFYISKGYAGMFVTDHFTGSTTVPKGTPWKERVEMFFDGYRAAAAHADDKDFKVFRGLEYSYKGNDFLFYNLSIDWMKENEFTSWQLHEILDAVRAAGAFVIHAHPFAEAPWIETVRLLPRRVDAVEVFNGPSSDEFNARAKWYALSYDLPQVAGSDAHGTDLPCLTGISIPTKAESENDIISAIRTRTAKLIV